MAVASYLQAVYDIVGYIHVGKKSVALKNHAHIPLFNGNISYIIFSEINAPALVWVFEPCNNAKRCRFAASGRTQYHNSLTGFNSQVDGLQSSLTVGESFGATMNSDRCSRLFFISAVSSFRDFTAAYWLLVFMSTFFISEGSVA